MKKQPKKVIRKAVPPDLEKGNSSKPLPPAVTTIPEEARAEVHLTPPPTKPPRAEVQTTPQPPPARKTTEQPTRSKDPHLHMPHIKLRITAPNPEKNKYSRTKIVKKWLETEKTAKLGLSKLQNVPNLVNQHFQQTKKEEN